MKQNQKNQQGPLNQTNPDNKAKQDKQSSSAIKNQDNQPGKEHSDTEHPHEQQTPVAKPSGK